MRRRRSQTESLEELASQRRNGQTEPTLPKTILVLGATSSIAQAWMRLLAPEGASFFLVARNTTHLDSVAKDVATRANL